jgi:hypothetical protein
VGRAATDEELEAFARFLARVTLEIERDLRPPEQLLRFMPARAWQQWQHARLPGKFAGGPVHRSDIGRPRIERLDDKRAIVNVVTRTDTERWGALTMRLDATSGRWRAASLQRLYAARHYRTGPPRPVVPVPIERRLATANTDRKQAAAALAAATRRAAELPKGSDGHRQTTSLSTTWKHLLAELDREISTLHHQQQTTLEIRHARQRSRRL